MRWFFLGFALIAWGHAGWGIAVWVVAFIPDCQDWCGSGPADTVVSDPPPSPRSRGHDTQ